MRHYLQAVEDNDRVWLFLHKKKVTLTMKQHTRLLHFIILLLLLIARLPAMGQTPGGIGAVLLLDTAKDGNTLPRIKELIPNSPAAAQNLPVSSYIIKVNETPCKNKSLEDVVNLIRGEAGTGVTLELADNPQGKKSKDYTVVRAPIRQVPAPDLAQAFNDYCDAEAKKLRKQGFAIIKTFSSECGDFFFNFEANAGTYHVRLLTAETKNAGTYNKGFEATANLFDNSNEAAKTPLQARASHDEGQVIIAELEGVISFSRSSVGVINVQIHPLADAARCAAQYVIVYK